MKQRINIPMDIRRGLLLECGYCCSVQHCKVDSSLEFHHIDGNPSNNAAPNLIVLCSNHHTACTSGRIDQKACKSMKQLLRPLRLSASSSILKGVRDIVTNELSKNLARTNKIKKDRIPAEFAVDRILHVLRFGKTPTYELYLAVRAAGAFRHPAATKELVRLLHRMRTSPQWRAPLVKREFYPAVVFALSRISSQEAVNAIADELAPSLRGAIRLGVNRILWLFSALASSRNARKYTGFEILSRETHKTKGDSITRIVFKMRNAKYIFSVKIEKLRAKHAA